jgi:hypothetical protein
MLEAQSNYDVTKTILVNRECCVKAEYPPDGAVTAGTEAVRQRKGGLGESRIFG